LNEFAPIKLKFLTKLLSIPSIAVKIPTKAIMPNEMIKQVITVLVTFVLMEAKASLMF
jgi:hypothetical protein